MKKQAQTVQLRPLFRKVIKIFPHSQPAPDREILLILELLRQTAGL